MSKRIYRMFQLLNYLAEGRSNIHTLTQELRISERQVYRDIHELRMIGFRIEIDRFSGNYIVGGRVILPTNSPTLEK